MSYTLFTKLITIILKYVGACENSPSNYLRVLRLYTIMYFIYFYVLNILFYVLYYYEVHSKCISHVYYSQIFEYDD